MMLKLCGPLAALATTLGLALVGAGSASAQSQHGVASTMQSATASSPYGASPSGVTGVAAHRSLGSVEAPWEYCYPYNIC